MDVEDSPELFDRAEEEIEAKNSVSEEDEAEAQEEQSDKLVYSPCKNDYVSIPKLDLEQLAVKKGQSQSKNENSQLEAKLVENKL